MSVGLPGSGIGGVFYLLSALWMPVDGAMRTMQKRERRSVRLIARQAALALAIIAAIYATGLGIEFLIAVVQGAQRTAGHAATAMAATPRVFKEAAFALTFSTLALVLLSVQIARVFFARPVTHGEDDTDQRKAA